MADPAPPAGASSSSSGLFGRLFGATTNKPATQAKLGVRNTMYYDEAAKRWVDPAAEGTGVSGAAADAARGPPVVPAMAAAAGAAPQPSSQLQHSQSAPAFPVRGRYVDPFAKKDAAAPPQPAAAPASFRPGAPTASDPAAAAAPRFMVPMVPGGGDGAAANDDRADAPAPILS